MILGSFFVQWCIECFTEHIAMFWWVFQLVFSSLLCSIMFILILENKIKKKLLVNQD